MYLYKDHERREVASIVYIDNYDNLQFVDYFENVGFTETFITPYCENPISPAITFSIGPLDFDAANPCNYYGDYYPGGGIITSDCDPYLNGVIRLATVFGKCMEIYDKEVAKQV